MFCYPFFLYYKNRFLVNKYFSLFTLIENKSIKFKLIVVQWVWEGISGIINLFGYHQIVIRIFKKLGFKNVHSISLKNITTNKKFYHSSKRTITLRSFYAYERATFHLNERFTRSDIVSFVHSIVCDRGSRDSPTFKMPKLVWFSWEMSS